MFKFYKSSSEIIETITENCLKMIKERKLIKDYDLKSIVNSIKNKYFYSLPLDNKDRDEIKIYDIYYFDQLRGQNSNLINEKLKVEKDKHKILIIDDIVASNIKKINKFAEIFKTSELMLNLIDFKYCPKVQLLTSEEGEKVLKDYNVTKKQLPQFDINDPMVRYYNGRKGDIFKIFRNSLVSGVSIAYRIVI